jgi:hypothetical protein
MKSLVTLKMNKTNLKLFKKIQVYGEKCYETSQNE